MKITICGGGNLGHVVAGFMAAHNNQVAVLTRHPERWSNTLQIIAPEGNTFVGKITATSVPKEAIPQADIIIVCLPGFAIKEELLKIRPFLKPTSIVGTVVSSTGFFFVAHEVLPITTRLFGFQRVPFICRVTEYGHEAELKGYKSSLSMAVENIDNPDNFAKVIEVLFQTPVKLLHSFYEVSLSNSNPLLHPARLYTLWKDWHKGIVYDRIPQFYSEWTVEASELYIKMDNELQCLLAHLPVKSGVIPSVLEYYESDNASSLTNKLRSIPAFQNILSPMIYDNEGKGYIPNFRSRYFTEDIPYGMRYIVDIARQRGLSLPIISRIFQWGCSYLKK